jgi:hypothetical protein
LELGFELGDVRFRLLERKAIAGAGIGELAVLLDPEPLELQLGAGRTEPSVAAS